MNTTYFLTLVANHTFGIQVNSNVPSLPSNYYIGLSTTSPTAAGGNVSEPSTSAGYSRKLITGLTTSTDGTTKNSSIISFNESTSSWGTITHFVIYDAASGGNLLMYGALSSPRVVEASTTMSIPVNNLVLSIQNVSN